ncbi:MAG: isocitrate lyase/phosphoenolpyruvate mutase family protein [Pseudomonadota bacterium]
MDQADKATVFRELHIPGKPFVLANAHDIGSARMLAAMGAEAIATTSSGFAFTVGEPDGAIVSRDTMLDHCEDLANAMAVPVSGDLENGYGDDPDSVGECIELAAETGLVSCCIEDSTFESVKPSYDFDIAVERIRVAVEAAEALPFDFMVCARADGVLIGSYAMDEAIARCQAFEEVGAHCVYVPMPPSMDDLATLCASVSVPVNALCAGPYVKFSKDDFAGVGVARISIGSALARATHRIILEAGHAMLDDGDFTGLGRSVSGAEIDKLLQQGGV